MKNIYYLIAVVLCTAFYACQNKDWDVPVEAADAYAKGNTSIKETNLMTIDAFKEKYEYECNTDGQCAKITEDIQIKGWVTANDRTNNFYKEIVIQDATGAITIGINEGGMFGVIPEGQEILIALKDLYIGNYRLAPVIGTPYKDKKLTTCVGRMPLSMWNQHYTLTGNKKTRAELDAMVELFGDGTNGKTTWKLKKDAAKLGIIKNVTVKIGGYYDNATEEYTPDIKFVPGESALVVTDPKSGETNSTSWYFNEFSDGQDGGIQIYTSNYAVFASNKIPTTHNSKGELVSAKMNITGIVKRYKNQWEFVIRDFSDIEVLN